VVSYDGIYGCTPESEEMNNLPTVERDLFIWSFQVYPDYQIFPLSREMGIDYLRSPDGTILGRTRKGITRVLLKVTDPTKFDEDSMRQLLSRLESIIGEQYHFKGFKPL